MFTTFPYNKLEIICFSAVLVSDPTREEEVNHVLFIVCSLYKNALFLN